MKARTFAPAHISCIFRTYRADSSEHTGSLGFGFTLDKGATVTVRRSKRTTIVVNEKEMPFETVRRVIDRLTDMPVEVLITTDVPFGSGFGMSGASALATGYALNQLLHLKMKPEELAMIAHVSEVKHGTGLGDVGGQYNGGILLRIERGKPLCVQRLRSRQQTIYFKVYGEIDTKAIITDNKKKAQIDKAGDRALQKIHAMKRRSFRKLIEVSKTFAHESGLLTSEHVRHDIELIEQQGGQASMIMLGEAVFGTIPLPGYRQAAISPKGVRIL